MSSPLIKYNSLNVCKSQKKTNHRYLAITERCTRELFQFQAKASLLGSSVYEVVRIAVSRVVGLLYTPGPFKTNQLLD